MLCGSGWVPKEEGLSIWMWMRTTGEAKPNSLFPFLERVVVSGMRIGAVPVRKEEALAADAMRCDAMLNPG